MSKENTILDFIGIPDGYVIPEAILSNPVFNKVSGVVKWNKIMTKPLLRYKDVLLGSLYKDGEGNIRRVIAIENRGSSMDNEDVIFSMDYSSGRYGRCGLCIGSYDYFKRNYELVTISNIEEWKEKAPLCFFCKNDCKDSRIKECAFYEEMGE